MIRFWNHCVDSGGDRNRLDWYGMVSTWGSAHFYQVGSSVDTCGSFVFEEAAFVVRWRVMVMPFSPKQKQRERLRMTVPGPANAENLVGRAAHFTQRTVILSQ